MVWRDDGRSGKKLRQWDEWFILANDTSKPLNPHTTADGTVHTDIAVWKITWRRRHGEAAFEHTRAKKVLTPVRSYGSTGLPRLDMRVSLPEEAGWGTRVVVTRVFAWYFLNHRQLNWKEFNKPHPNPRSDAFFWQVDHTNDEPSKTLADKLELTEYWRNERRARAAAMDRNTRQRVASPPRALPATSTEPTDNGPPPAAAQAASTTDTTPAPAATAPLEATEAPTDTATAPEPTAEPREPAAPTLEETTDHQDTPPGADALVYPTRFVQPPTSYQDIDRALREGYNPLWDPTYWEPTERRNTQLRERAELQGGTAPLITELTIRSQQALHARLLRDTEAALSGGTAGNSSSSSQLPSANTDTTG
jgi:hypothetical protein